jgi:sulfotransferase family protein
MRRSKIFGIGLSKTGTTSLTEALRILGFSAVHYPTSIREIELHDAAADLPVADAFESLDATFPGSKFIYTVRERTRWVESCRRHWKRKQGEIEDIRREFRRRLYGTIDFDPDLFVQAYNRHEHRVLSYFAARPHDLLVLDICGGRADWGMLCSFLGAPVPHTPFPNTNRLDSFDEIMIRLLHITHSAEQVAQLAKVSTQYVEELWASEAFRNHNTEGSLSSDGNQKRVDRTLKRACSHFGSVNAAAAKLKLPRSFLEDAMARHRRRKRAKLFKEWQLKLHQLVRRTPGG